MLDVLANNTDRKTGHCLLAHGRVWAIDNGLCFSAPFKLRTVIWEFAGESIPAPLLQRVERVADRVPVDVAALLGEDEIGASNTAPPHSCAPACSLPTDRGTATRGRWYE